MLTVILMMFSGILTGRLLVRWHFAGIGHVTMLLIWLLLFALGLNIGSNPDIISNLGTLGVEALAIAMTAMLGSVTMAKLLWMWISGGRHDEHNRVNETNEANGASHPSLFRQLRGSLVILAFFTIGVILGLSGLVPTEFARGNWSFGVLCALLFSVGFSVGNTAGMLRRFRSLNPRLTLLPIGTIVGTLVACFLLGLVMPGRSLTDVLAVGSGQAYYSLSSILITQYRGAELGTIALLANIMRELLTMLTAPLLVRVFGRLAPIASGGATTMDTTMPIILQTSGPEFAFLAIYHGFIVDFSVPFIVTFFCSL